MAKSKDNQAALAIAPEGGALANTNDALAMFEDMDFEVTGLEEVDAEDLRFAVKVWNMRSQRPDGQGLFQVNEFFDTLTETTSKELNCVFVTLHKTNDYSYYDNDKSETVRVCTSYDRQHGTLRVVHPYTKQPEGLVRACETCPDAQWRKDDKGKNVKNCSTVYGVIAIELDAGGNPVAPFMIRFKRTSLAAFKNHMQKHHIKRRRDNKTGRMVDVPLFAYPVRITLQADPKGQFATPVIERGELLSRDFVMHCADRAKDYREMADDVTRAAEKKESQHGTEGVVETTGESIKDSDFV